MACTTAAAAAAAVTSGGTAVASRLIPISTASSGGPGVTSVAATPATPASPPAAAGEVGGEVSPSRPLLSGRHRVIKTILSAELDPVTEIPGEGGPEDDPDAVGGRGVPSPLNTRRNSGSFHHHRHHRRRSSSGSSSMHASILEEGKLAREAGKGTAGEEEDGGEGEENEGRGEERFQERYQEQSHSPQVAAGLVLEVRVSAPLICVLLVHDNSSSSGDGDGSGSGGGGGGGKYSDQSVSASHSTGSGTADAEHSDAVVTVSSGGGVEGAPGVSHVSPPPPPLPPPPGEGAEPEPGEAVIEGALALVEICGLGVEYRDTLGGGGGDRGGGGTGGKTRGRTSALGPVTPQSKGGGLRLPGIADGETSPKSTPGGSNYDCRPRCCKFFCLTAAYFRVKDMHQQVTGGDDDAGFSYLLSSTDPSLAPPAEVASSAAPTLLPVEQEDTVKITYALASEGDDGGSGNGGASGRPEARTTVRLGGVWANWNPETVGALSIFAYGMYGNSSGGISAGVSADERGGVEGGDSRTADDGGGDDVKHVIDVLVPPSSGGSSGASAPAPPPPPPPPQAQGMEGEFEGKTATAKGGDVHAVAKETGLPKIASPEEGVPGGVFVVEIRRLSLWLNKEFHGRRLVLLEAGESTVSVTRIKTLLLLLYSGIFCR